MRCGLVRQTDIERGEGGKTRWRNTDQERSRGRDSTQSELINIQKDRQGEGTSDGEKEMSQWRDFKSEESDKERDLYRGEKEGMS